MGTDDLGAIIKAARDKPWFFGCNPGDTHALILLHKPSQHTTRKVYTFVPTQAWTKQWTDSDLYTKYGLSESEIAFIEKIVHPMDFTGGATDEVISDVDEDE